jgi:hypothetical protein
MKNYIAQELRKRSVVVGKERTWISNLSDHELWQLYLKLRAGEPSRAVAKYIQERWKLKEKSQIHSIAQGITKFRKRIGDLLELQLPEDSGETKPKEEPLSPLEWSDSLLRSERIAKMAAERVERMLLEEKQGIKHPGLSRDLQAASQLQKQLLREKQFEIAHPDQDVIKQKRDKMRDRRIDENFNALMADDEGERLLKFTDRFLGELAKHAFTATYNPETGMWDEVEE